MRTIEVPPKPSSLLESLSDIGYLLGTALADLVDNSITAQAKTIEIFSNVGESSPKIGVLDDGHGMDEETLIEAMRLGTKSPLEERDKSDLGRFGLGLKTASFSQCRVVTVVSRRNGTTAIARWDLNRIAESEKWAVELPDNLAGIPWADRLGSQGTLVVWDDLRLARHEETSESANEDLTRQLNDASNHLQLVFHRFLSGEIRGRKMQILLNNRNLEPFDPFHSSHPATMQAPEETIKFVGESVKVKAFTLPHHSNVSPEQWERYAGPEGYFRNQGFYIYREGRLIIHGTWFGLARQQELTKLARVRVDMPNSLDSVWRIDVKKASAQLPAVVRTRLRQIIERLAEPSKRIYTARGTRLAQDSLVPVWSRIQDKGEIRYRINADHPVVVNLLENISDQERVELRRFMEMIGSALPIDALFADLGGNVNSVKNSSTSDDTLRPMAATTYEHLLEILGSRDDALDAMQVSEPFRSNWERTLEILQEHLQGVTARD